MSYQLKITLCEIEPPIWRRIRVSGKMTFGQLHSVIQAAFGWLDYHLYRFEGSGIIVYDEEPDYAMTPPEERPQRLDPELTPIKDLLEAHDRLIYEYDLGDGWRHEILVEKRLKEDKKYAIPVCLDGGRHRPPEDVGGAGGYEDFLRIINNFKHPERAEMLNWAEKDTGGRLFDPEYFYAEETNRSLRHVLDDTPESAHALLAAPGGLSGALTPGWSGPIVKAGDDVYTWERLGRLLSMLDEDVPVTIKVGRTGGARKR